MFVYLGLIYSHPCKKRKGWGTLCPVCVEEIKNKSLGHPRTPERKWDR